LLGGSEVLLVDIYQGLGHVRLLPQQYILTHAR
jgi:hypothetical protein